MRAHAARCRYVVAHAGLRGILGHCLDVPPVRIRFEYGAYGKPHLFPASRWNFSLAHSGDVALVAVSRGRLVGVDVEEFRPDVRALELAERFFPEDEARALAAFPPSGRAAAFTRLWILKEAVGKALGCGLRPSVVGRFIAPEVLKRDVVMRHFDTWPLTGTWVVCLFTPTQTSIAAVAGTGGEWRPTFHEWTG